MGVFLFYVRVVNFRFQQSGIIIHESTSIVAILSILQAQNKPFLYINKYKLITDFTIHTERDT